MQSLPDSLYRSIYNYSRNPSLLFVSKKTNDLLREQIYFERKLTEETKLRLFLDKDKGSFKKQYEEMKDIYDEILKNKYRLRYENIIRNQSIHNILEWRKIAYQETYDKTVGMYSTPDTIKKYIDSIDLIEHLLSGLVYRDEDTEITNFLKSEKKYHSEIDDWYQYTLRGIADSIGFLTDDGMDEDLTPEQQESVEELKEYEKRVKEFVSKILL